MSDLITVDKKVLAKMSPNQLAQTIIDAGELLDRSENRVADIRERGFFKRLFSNNTRDLANVMADQNQAMQLFLNMLQAIIAINMNNTVVLAQVLEALRKHQKATEYNGNEYLSVAENFLAETYASAVAFKEKFDNLFDRVERNEGSLNELHTAFAEAEATAAENYGVLNDRLDESNTKLAAIVSQIEGLREIAAGAEAESERLASKTELNRTLVIISLAGTGACLFGLLYALLGQ